VPSVLPPSTTTTSSPTPRSARSASCRRTERRDPELHAAAPLEEHGAQERPLPDRHPGVGHDGLDGLGADRDERDPNPRLSRRAVAGRGPVDRVDLGW